MLDLRTGWMSPRSDGSSSNCSVQSVSILCSSLLSFCRRSRSSPGNAAVPYRRPRSRRSRLPQEVSSCLELLDVQVSTHASLLQGLLCLVEAQVQSLLELTMGDLCLAVLLQSPIRSLPVAGIPGERSARGRDLLPFPAPNSHPYGRPLSTPIRTRSDSFVTTMDMQRIPRSVRLSSSDRRRPAMHSRSCRVMPISGTSI